MSASVPVRYSLLRTIHISAWDTKGKGRKGITISEKILYFSDGRSRGLGPGWEGELVLYSTVI